MQLIDYVRRLYMAAMAAGSSFRVRDYEAASLLAWKMQLSQPASTLLNKQLGMITWVTRISKEKLVNLHSDFKEWPTDVSFPVHQKLPIARVVIRPHGSDSRGLKCDFSFYRGRLFGLEFDQPPREVFPVSQTIKATELIHIDIESMNSVEVIGVQTFADPLEQEVIGRDTNVGPVELNDYVKEWSDRWHIAKLRKPLTESKRNRYVAQIDARLPMDYLNLSLQTEGLQIGPWTILGLSEVYKIVRPDGNFYILAHLDESHDLAISQGDQDGVLYFIPYEGDLAEPAGTDFQSVITRRLAVGALET